MRMKKRQAEASGSNEVMRQANDREQVQSETSELGSAGTTAFSGSGLLTVNEAAQYLRTSRTTLYRLIDRGELAVVRLSKAPRFLRSDLDALIANKREQTKASVNEHSK